MIVIAPGVWCDPCIAPIIKALHESDLPTVPTRHGPDGIRTVASCCGHGVHPGRISLADGRELLIYASINESPWGRQEAPVVSVEDVARVILDAWSWDGDGTQPPPEVRAATAVLALLNPKEES